MSIFDNISKQFLCCVPINSIDGKEIFKHLSYEDQEILLNKTVNFQLVVERPLNIDYQKRFLKRLITELELAESVIHDEVYYAYSRLLATPTTDAEYFKHYRIGNARNILSLKESNAFGEGTTGLITWQAALVLSEWCINNSDTFENKTVLELGSGLGLTGLVLATECSPRSVYLSDCHPRVLKTLYDNVTLNIGCSSRDTLQALRHRYLYSHLGPPSISILKLPWEDVDEELCENLQHIDKVIAADVVYNDELFEPLIQALCNLCNFSGVEEIIFSCTERNPDTLESFIKRINEKSFLVEELESPERRNFIWPTDTPIRLYRFKKQ